MDINITRRKRRRVQRDGSIKHQVRWIVNWHAEGMRNQRFFETRLEAQEFRSKLLTNAIPAKREPTTVESVVQTWLASKSRTTRANTFATYEFRAKLLKPLFPLRLDKLTTRDIRCWHEGVASAHVYSAGKALGVLKSALALHAEDTGARAIAMPNGLQRRPERPTRKHLSIEQVRTVVANGDLFVAWSFLTGTRISEQLGLCWDCVDFDAGVVTIRRTQDKVTGKLVESTKTESGTRTIPMSATLRRMLTDWKDRCPSRDRVFPAEDGGALPYLNFLRLAWKPALKRMGLPYVSPHSARASFISMLQANGTDVAVAAKLAGHKSPAVTLGFYTHALKDGEQAIAALDESYAETTV